MRQPQMNDHDYAVWHTLDIMRRIDRGRLHERPPVATTFAPQIARDEHGLACGPFRLLGYCTAGDGSYVHNSSTFFAWGRGGLAMTAGFAAGQAIGNASRRSRARADAQLAWREIDRGHLWVCDRGFYLDTPGGLFTWEWTAVSSMQLVAPASVQVTGNSTSGQIQWIIESDWAELVLTVWAYHCHPNHPQYISGAWIPPGWQERVRATGYSMPALPGS